MNPRSKPATDASSLYLKYFKRPDLEISVPEAEKGSSGIEVRGMDRMGAPGPGDRAADTVPAA